MAGALIGEFTSLGKPVNNAWKPTGWLKQISSTQDSRQSLAEFRTTKQLIERELSTGACPASSVGSRQ